MNPPVEQDNNLLHLHTVENVKENKTSKREKKKAQIVSYIVNDIKKIPNISKTSICWIQRTCDLIENMVKKKDKIDKWLLIVKVFQLLFPNNSPADLDALKEIIQHLMDNKLIKKVTKHVKLFSYMKKVIVSNFLFRNT
jgi:hypothetical protein